MTAPILPSRWLITSTDMADDPDVFPFLAGQSFQLLKTPMWNSKIDIAVSGTERRRALWSYPIWLFRLQHEVLRDGSSYLELQRLVTFFNMKFGSVTGFFYYDRDDHSVANVQFGTGDGVTTTFQLVRTVTIGGYSFTEPVRGLNGSPTVMIGGTPTAAFTVGTFGDITFTSAPANGTVLTWTGSYFFLCRFDKDQLDLSKIGQGLWASGQLDFRSWKP
jgi:uncharacterized protein (TIGR02217 family)